MGLDKLLYNRITLDTAIWLALTENCPDPESANEPYLMYVRKFGKSPASMTANTQYALWSGSSNKTFLSTAEYINIVSSDAADIVAGTGARYVLIKGLDSNYKMQSETIALNGTTPVTTTKKFIRINESRVVAAGSGKKNAGLITMTDATGATPQDYIPIGESASHSSYMCCPAGYNAIAIDTNLSLYRESGSGTKRGEIHVFSEITIPVLGGRVTYAANEYGLSNDGSSSITYRPRLPSCIPEKLDLWYAVTPESTATIATVQYSWLLIKSTFMDNIGIYG